MKKFGLLLVNREWQLWPNTPDAYRDGSEKMVKQANGDWVDGIQALKRDREVFIFRNGVPKLSVVLNSLQRAGISDDDIEVESHCRKCEHPKREHAHGHCISDKDRAATPANKFFDQSCLCECKEVFQKQKYIVTEDYRVIGPECRPLYEGGNKDFAEEFAAFLNSPRYDALVEAWLGANDYPLSEAEWREIMRRISIRGEQG